MQELILTYWQGGALLAGYGLAMMILALVSSRRRTSKQADFILANRRVGVLAGAMSSAATWIWAPALFVSSQKAYTHGVAGVLSFCVPNFLALIVFAPVALRVRRMLPKGYTLPEYMLKRFGRGVHRLYLVQFFGLQICSFAIQILAGSSLLSMVTGIDFFIVALSTVVIALSYSLLGGLRASIMTDVLQMGLMLAIIGVIVPWVVLSSGDNFSSVVGGLAGVSGQYGNPFDPWVLYTFGIPSTVALLSGPLGDQMHWQRAYAMASDRIVKRTYFLAALFFISVPLALSLLGFVAANPAVGGAWTIESVQMVGPITVAQLLPKGALIIFCAMLLCGLGSTLDSILCAASALTVVDICQGERSEERGIKIAQWGMLGTAAVGLMIALVPGMKIIHLWLFAGAFRAATMIPTIGAVYNAAISGRAVFIAVLSSLLIGGPLYITGVLVKNPHLVTGGSISVVLLGALIVFGPRLLCLCKSEQNRFVGRSKAQAPLDENSQQRSEPWL